METVRIPREIAIGVSESMNMLRCFDISPGSRAGQDGTAMAQEILISD
ncbi:hypothetical protein NIA71_06180 [Ihubacter massiliensis]|nr:hypothetical protein [Ihubacter massiliensis]MCO7121542.1 hypothetical protein [Ihubacter massiliensis]